MTAMTLLCVLITYHPVAVDSTLYCLDAAGQQLNKLNLGAEIIDYTVDGSLYVLTPRRLFKVLLPDLQVTARAPVPIRFNYMTVGQDDIILISTEEIITIDKNNLSFKSGIGIEPGDYRPLFAPSELAAFGKSRLLYLAADLGDRTHLKIFDLKTGKLVKSKQVPRIISHYYDARTGTIACLDQKDNLVHYDLDLKRLKQNKVMMHGEMLTPYRRAPGYLVYEPQAVYWIGADGAILDFQPVYAADRRGYSNFQFLTRQGVLTLDPLTLRPKRVITGGDALDIVRIAPLDDRSSAGISGDGSVCLINGGLTMMPTAGRAAMTLEPPPPMKMTGDSLWYIQFAAFSGYDNARACSDSLARAGLPVVIDSSDLYRIKLGGFIDQETGRIVLESIDGAGWLIYQAGIDNPAAGSSFTVNGRRYILANGVITLEKE